MNEDEFIADDVYSGYRRVKTLCGKYEGFLNDLGRPYFRDESGAFFVWFANKLIPWTYEEAAEEFKQILPKLVDYSVLDLETFVYF